MLLLFVNLITPLVWNGKKTFDQNNVRAVQNATNKLIKDAKLAYFTNLGAKLSDPKIGQSNFWTAYKNC